MGKFHTEYDVLFQEVGHTMDSSDSKPNGRNLIFVQTCRKIDWLIFVTCLQKKVGEKHEWNLIRRSLQTAGKKSA